MLNFFEIADHKLLGKTLDRIGDTRFWDIFIELLSNWIPFSNALVTLIPPFKPPQLLFEFDREIPLQPSIVPQYLVGMYLLDPFLLAKKEYLADGFYRLSDVAPDSFRESEYFLSYFRPSVGEDEVQFLVTLESGTLSLSMGSLMPFEHKYIGILCLIAPWILSMLKLQGKSIKVSQFSDLTLAEQVQDTLENFCPNVLTRREAEIVQFTLRGHSSKSISDKMNISIETVRSHRRHLYTKLGITSQSELFSLFLRQLSLIQKN